MKAIKVMFLLVTCSLSIMAQSMSVYQGEQQILFNLNEIDSIKFDPTPNMWLNAEKELGFYYAPGWNQTTDPTYTEKNGTYSVTLSKATTEQCAGILQPRQQGAVERSVWHLVYQRQPCRS